MSVCACLCGWQVAEHEGRKAGGNVALGAGQFAVEAGGRAAQASYHAATAAFESVSHVAGAGFDYVNALVMQPC